jgi:2-oxoisovalerate dehydrogenase E2 component (dihydrolipoyl transacylase)
MTLANRSQITSRFDGVIKKLYYEADDMAKVGKVSLHLEIFADDELTVEAFGRHRHSKRDLRS